VSWREVPNFPFYEINREGMVREMLAGGRLLVTSYNNRGEHYHLESPSGRVIAMKKTQLVAWAFPKKEVEV
jgi:hypothetical protein